MAPLCGGYFVRDVNRKTPERYVSALVLPSTLDAATGAKVTDALPEERRLRGKLGPKDAKYGTQTCLITSAYRGMPGMGPLAGDVFYSAKPRAPKISCKAAPCSNEVATKLNSTAVTCTLPGDCVAAKGCPAKVPAQCADGYQVTAWNPTGGSQCLTFACDPAFVWQ